MTTENQLLREAYEKWLKTQVFRPDYATWLSFQAGAALTHPASQEQAQQPSPASAADMAVYQSIADGYLNAQPSGGEVVAWRTFDGEGGYEYRDFEGNENYAEEWAKRNPRHKGWVEPLTLATPKPEPRDA